jgi:hypothetical protein
MKNLIYAFLAVAFVAESAGAITFEKDENPFDKYDTFDLFSEVAKCHAIKNNTGRLQCFDDAAFLSEFGKYKQDKEPALGHGPHTLIVSSRDGAMTRMQFKTGKLCLKAQDAIRKQVEPPLVTIRPITYVEPPLTAVCVPH